MDPDALYTCIYIYTHIYICTFGYIELEIFNTFGYRLRDIFGQFENSSLDHGDSEPWPAWLPATELGELGHAGVWAMGFHWDFTLGVVDRKSINCHFLWWKKKWIYEWYLEMFIGNMKILMWNGTFSWFLVLHIQYLDMYQGRSNVLWFH